MKNSTEDWISPDIKDSNPQILRSLYRDKLNSFFHPDTKDTTHTSCGNFPSKDDFDDPRARGSVMAESISRRRMKLKGLACPTENNQIFRDNRKPSTPSSVFENDNHF
jgi:hypothetical protein